MGGIISNLGNVVDRATWETNRQWRILQMQNAIAAVNDQLRSKKLDLAEATMKVVQDGTALPAPITTIAGEIVTLQGQVKDYQEEIDRVKKEEPPSPERTCTSCGQVYSSVYKFCPYCGAAASKLTHEPAATSGSTGTDTVPPQPAPSVVAPEAPAAAPVVQTPPAVSQLAPAPAAAKLMLNCPHCGATLSRPNAKFCAICGKPTQEG
ncbi:MAG: zinc ribbon domain-containing protein [Chloroflexi bacterium]|nr:zinc ribbon domain-containing protein [Chloroflexota bacterium]